MLVESIANEFNAYFQHSSDHDTILWFDPTREWEGLLPYLKPHLPLLSFKGSQLRLRYELAKRQQGERAIVYLPMEQKAARYLRPFFYTSKCYRASIEKVLWGAGVGLPTDPAILRRLRPLLPALAVASVGKGRIFWDSIVNVETALGRLVTDLDDSLLRLLADPRRTTVDLDRRASKDPFFHLVEIEFGIEPPEPGQEDAWSDRFTAQLCLVETYLSTGQAQDFPFEDVLPQPVHWDRCRSFLRKWQHHDLFKPAFRQRAKAIDGQYSLGSWAMETSLAATTSAFLNVEIALWDTTQGELEAIEGKAGAIAFCRARRRDFRERAEGFWARDADAEVPGWRALTRMAEVILSAQDAMNEVDRYSTAIEMIDRYAKTWWQIDRGYRYFLVELDRGGGHLDAALKWTGRIYRDYMEQVNERFADLVSQAGVWPPKGRQAGAGSLWDQRPTSTSGLHALVLVDALRYELGRELAERLEVDPTRVSADLSPVPSVTGLGMAALLPGWPEFQVDYAKGEWTITPPDGTENLARKDKRLSWLVAHLGPASVFSLDEWLATPLGEIDQTSGWIVITSSAFDSIGEGAGTVALHTFDTLLDRLEQGVRRLLTAGCTNAHIVTDHGFLLREAVRDSDKVSANVEGVLKKGERYLVGRDLPPTDLPHLPVPGSHDLVAWYPRGIGCFATPGPYNYMHGGIALQEVVVPHLNVQQSVAERLVGVSLQVVAGPEIRNAIFKVRLVPGEVDLLTRPRRVEIDIVKGGRRVSRVWEERVEHEVVERSLMLEPDYGLLLGDQVQIRARDATTGELLGEQPAVIQVDLDL